MVLHAGPVIRSPAFYNNGTDYLTRIDQGIRLLDDQLLQFGSANGTDADLYYDGTNMVYDVNSGYHSFVGGDVHLANGTGMIIGHTAQVDEPLLAEFQLLGNGANDAVLMIGRWSANTGAPTIYFLKSRDPEIFDATYAVVENNDLIGELRWYPDDGVDMSTLAARFWAEVDDASPAAGDIGMAFVWQQMPGAAGSTRRTMRLAADGQLLVGGSSSHGNAGNGIIIDQLGNDNIAFAVKSSDVTTGLSTGTLAMDVETDDYLTIGKRAADGGMYAQILAGGTLTQYAGFEVYGQGAVATSDTSTTIGAVSWYVGKHDGANALTDHGANTSIFTWGEIASGAKATRMLLKSDDGELHLGNTTLVALDDEDDVMMLRGLRRVTGGGGGFRDSVWETQNPYRDYHALKSLGLIGELDDQGFALFPVQTRLAAHEDSMWQLLEDIMEIASVLPKKSKQALRGRMQKRLALAAA